MEGADRSGGTGDVSYSGHERRSEREARRPRFRCAGLAAREAGCISRHLLVLALHHRPQGMEGGQLLRSGMGRRPTFEGGRPWAAGVFEVAKGCAEVRLRPCLRTWRRCRAPPCLSWNVPVAHLGARTAHLVNPNDQPMDFGEVPPLAEWSARCRHHRRGQTQQGRTSDDPRALSRPPRVPPSGVLGRSSVSRRSAAVNW